MKYSAHISIGGRECVGEIEMRVSFVKIQNLTFNGWKLKLEAMNFEAEHTEKRFMPYEVLDGK